MPKLRLSAAAVLLLSISRLHAADAPAPAAPAEVVAAPLAQEAEMARLEALPPSHIPLKGATLASAIRLLAQAAHMSYLSPAEADFSERVTSDVRMNPYALIQILAENYNFAADYRGGVWQFYRINLNELVSKSYTLRFNNMQQVSITSSGINSQLAAMGSMTNGGGAGAGGSGSSYASSAGSGKSSAFTVKTDKIIDDIKKILGVPTAGLETLSLEGSSAVPGIGAARKSVDSPKIEPIWNPDTSQLFVVATRQQHSLIASYLKTVDRPQKLIRISVKFIETARNPTQALGVDWSNTPLGSGGPISLGGWATETKDPITGGAIFQGPPDARLVTGVDLNHPGNTKLPPIALLSAPAFQWTVQAIASDHMSSIVQDPVIYTSNNREVSFKATSQQPIQEGTTTIGSATAATTSQIAYIDVGTEVTILPCILPGSGPAKELVQLNLSINVSSIIGQQTINGNQYPITSSRTYAYSVAIPNGETLAIAGLEERSRQTTDNKIPIFGDLPLIGYAFKNKSDSVIHTTLLAFITPELIQTESTAPPGEAAVVPPFRHRLFQGAKDESLSQVVQSLEGMPADITALQASANRLNKDSVLNRFGQMAIELSLIDVRLGELRMAKDELTAPTSLRAERVRRQLDAAREGVERLPIADKVES